MTATGLLVRAVLWVATDPRYASHTFSTGDPLPLKWAVALASPPFLSWQWPALYHSA